MSGDCNCNYRASANSYRIPDLVYKIRRVAAFLGISAAEINTCHMSLGELISIIRKRSHQHPHLWSFLRATYTNANFSWALSRLSRSGNSSQICKIIEMANNGHSPAGAEAYVDELLKKQGGNLKTSA